MNEDVIIVTRHSGAVDWLNRRGIRGRVVPRATRDDVFNQIVVGNPPLHLAYLARRVGLIDLPYVPEKLRGKELSADEMERFGAKISWYRIYNDT